MELEAFLTRWTAREGGAERANYQGFLYELCDVLGVARPEVSGADASRNNYVFERAVRQRRPECAGAPRRIDLYKRGCFILEAKQSRLPGRKNALPGQFEMLEEPVALGRRSIARGWDVMMLNARRQAEAYVFLLDADHAAPPFLITCDVGNCLELYADFSGTGRGYGPFPDRQNFRVYLHDLRDPAVLDRLKTVWENPASLDPTRAAAQVTRGIAQQLAIISKALEARHNG
ncbi:type IIL restriction-modification enzyme MmeI [Methylopila sp. M107]|uniref:type IIL restriction-modification enzyme MmeI n=1 Tax=Methylopila sp. M107 TaxID=1101190 RepID=UPI00035FA5A8|nr:type IIL restriction-modification enzyme MmeI [Methylopila sp. M107]